MANVQREINRQRNPVAGRLSFWRVAWAGGVLGLLAFAILQWPSRRDAGLPSVQTTAPVIDHVRVAEETRMSLACIGYTLMEVGNSTETIIKEQTVPMLRNSLEKLKQSLSKQI